MGKNGNQLSKSVIEEAKRGGFFTLDESYNGGTVALISANLVRPQKLKAVNESLMPKVFKELSDCLESLLHESLCFSI